MKNDQEKVTIPINGKPTLISEEQLWAFYEKTGDPFAKSHAARVFRYYLKREEREKRVEEARKSPETLYEYILSQFRNDFDYCFDYFDGYVEDYVFDLIAELPVEKIRELHEKFEIADTTKNPFGREIPYGSKVKAILAQKERESSLEEK